MSRPRLRPVEPVSPRRRQIVERLAAQDLPVDVAGWREEPLWEPGELGSRLAAAVVGLGAVPEAFGAYLSCRPDLLSGADCAALAALPERAPAAPGAEVLALVGRELALPPEELFAAFEDEPFDSRRFVQLHSARGADRRPLRVKVVRADHTAALGEELAALGALAPALASAGVELAPARADFQRALLRQLDLAAEARAIEAVAAGAPPGVAVAAPVSGLAARSVLAVTAIDGEPLLATGGGEPGQARRLWYLWLRLLIEGPAAPMELAGDDLRQLPDGRLLVLGGAWCDHPPDLQRRLLAWLLAAARREPDAVAAKLAPELADPGGRLAELAPRLRQATCLRDGGWGDGGDALDQEVLLQLRVARGLGLAASERLTDVVPGLVRVASLARRLDPGADGLRQALEELDVSRRARDLSELLHWERLSGNLERHAVLFAGLPERLDELLTRAAADPPAPSVVVAPAPPARAGTGAVAVAAAAALGLGALALLVRQLSAAGVSWAEAPATVLAVVLGALVLRGLGGRR